MDGRFSPRSAHSDDALAQTLHDPMFEPQPSFNFAESHNEEPCPLQPSMGSPNAPNQNQNQQTIFNPVNGTSFEPDFPFNNNANQFPQSTSVFGQQLDPVHVWQGQTAHGGAFNGAFPEASSMQQIVQSRKTTHQQFGQITPPDDSMNEFGESKIATGEAVVTEAALRAKSDKSERARNAANQRHAKAKKMRKDSESSIPVESDDGEGEIGDKKEKYREKNRLAAAKCRAKKKENIEDIEVKHRKLSAMNSSLKKQVQDLRGELTGLRTHALNHQDCNCQISRYNINQAKRVALGAEAPSPSMGFGGIGSSFSYMRTPPGLGEMGRMPSLSNFNSPSNFAFASVTTPDDMGGMQSQEHSPYLGDYMQTGYGGQPFSQG